jgi:hypothetical protein
LKKKTKRTIKKKGKCWSVEHSAVGSEVVTVFTIIFGV